jgi:transcriptional regulator with XRE-family HTH domain
LTFESEYPNYTDVSLGETIRTLRQKRRMQQKDLAKRLGVPQSSVAGWEAGDNNPRADRLRPLAKALGVNVARLTEAILDDAEKLA